MQSAGLCAGLLKVGITFRFQINSQFWHFQLQADLHEKVYINYSLRGHTLIMATTWEGLVNWYIGRLANWRHSISDVMLLSNNVVIL